jgi:hypothetical protein
MNMRKELELENNGNENDGEKTKHLEKKRCEEDKKMRDVGRGRKEKFAFNE